MTTTKDNNFTRKLDGKDFEGNTMTFGDKNHEYPREEYANSTSVNKAASGSGKSADLNMVGSAPGIDLSDYTGMIESQYPKNQVIETESGHIIEYNDTPGSERVLIKHSSGSGVDIRPDGTIVVAAQGDGAVEVYHGGHKLIVTGEGQLNYSGNLTLNVGGDFNLNVGGSYNVQVGTETKTVKGNSRDFYLGSKYATVNGSRQDIYTRNRTETVLGNKADYIKGNHKLVAEGSSMHAIKGQMSMTSEDQMIQTSPDINIAAENLSVFGDNGNIGGDNIIMHNYNMFTKNTVKAGLTMDAPVGNYRRLNGTSAHYTTFHGSLHGKAQYAADADRSAGLGSGGGSYSNTSADDAANNLVGETYRADATLMTEYLGQGSYGVQKVTVDFGQQIFNSINKWEETGGVTEQHLTTPEIRAKKRDEGHHTNAKFNNYQVGAKQLNPRHNNTIPESVEMVLDPKNIAVAGGSKVSASSDTKSRVVASVKNKKKIVMEKRFDINSYEVVIPNTLLTHGISFSQFIFGKGNPAKFDVTMSLSDKKQILRNLLPQAEFVRRIRTDNDQFKNYNIEIVEGLYTKEPEEIITTDGILDLRTKGRAVVYELVGPNGAVDLDKTFDLATWIVKNISYDKLILDYDDYDPSEELNAQIILVMPEIPTTMEATYKMEVETLYNGKKQESKLMKIAKKVSDVPTTKTTEDEGLDDRKAEPF